MASVCSKYLTLPDGIEQMVAKSAFGFVHGKPEDVEAKSHQDLLLRKKKKERKKWRMG
jgi:hypothetical protein